MDSRLDPLDSPDFDPIEYINQKFPTESSLEDLDTFADFINSQIALQDVELSRAIQTQSIAGKQGTQVLFLKFSLCKWCRILLMLKVLL